MQKHDERSTPVAILLPCLFGVGRVKFVDVVNYVACTHDTPGGMAIGYAVYAMQTGTLSQRRK